MRYALEGGFSGFVQKVSVSNGEKRRCIYEEEGSCGLEVEVEVWIFDSTVKLCCLRIVGVGCEECRVQVTRVQRLQPVYGLRITYGWGLGVKTVSWTGGRVLLRVERVYEYHTLLELSLDGLMGWGWWMK